jgi:hypothetical protein
MTDLPTPADVPEKLELRSHDVMAEKRDELLRLFPEVRMEGGKLDYEILLKSGFPITERVETLTIEGKMVYSVAEGALLVRLEREFTLELIRALAERKPERVVCLDAGFAGNGPLKANAVKIFQAEDVFRTV